MALGRKIKLTKTVVITGLGVAILLGGTVISTVSIYSNKIKDQRVQYEAIIQTKDNELQRYVLSSRKGFVLSKDLEAGDIVKEEDIQLIDIPDFFAPTDVIGDKESLVGKIVKINVKSQTPVTSNMVYAEGPIDPSLRKIEIDYARLPIKIGVKDVLDVRIIFPNGEDYLVLSKKKMTSLDVANQTMFVNLDIEEIHLMDSALVDAYIEKAEIYAVQYVEPEMQDEPPATYYPNLDVLKVIKSDPRIVNKARYAAADAVRKSLNLRLNAIDAADKIRIGASLPDGSAVAKRKSTIGAQITVSEENSATPTEEEESKYPAGYVPPEGAETEPVVENETTVQEGTITPTIGDE